MALIFGVISLQGSLPSVYYFHSTPYVQSDFLSVCYFRKRHPREHTYNSVHQEVFSFDREYIYNQFLKVNKTDQLSVYLT